LGLASFFPSIKNFVGTTLPLCLAMQFTEACMNKLAAMLPSVVDDLLVETLMTPETRRSTRNKKRNVTIFDESHLDAAKTTVASLVSPMAKRRKVTPSPLPRYMTPRPSIVRDADNSLGTLARRFSNLMQVRCRCQVQRFLRCFTWLLRNLAQPASSFFPTQLSPFPPQNQPGQTIEVKDAAEILQVERRRLYDVINVFEGTKLVVPAEQGRYRWVVTQNQKDDQMLQHQLEGLRDEEFQLDHWIEILHAQTDAIQDSHPNLHVTSDHLQRILPHQETLLAIVSPPGSQLLSDASQPQAVTIRLPTNNVIPQAFLMETNQHQIVNLELEEAFMPAPPLLDTCASGLTIDSATWDGDKNHSEWFQGFLLPPPVRRSSSEAANAA
jgi:hypothetical protein